MISEEELNEMELRCIKAQRGPWKAYIENRDHECGDSFIMTTEGENQCGDIYLIGATDADYDFIAAAKQDIPKLIKAIRELKKVDSK